MWGFEGFCSVEKSIQEGNEEGLGKITSQCKYRTLQDQLEDTLILELSNSLQPYVCRGEMNSKKLQRRAILRSFRRPKIPVER